MAVSFANNDGNMYDTFDGIDKLNWYQCKRKKKGSNLSQHFQKLHSQYSYAARKTGNVIHVCGYWNVIRT